MKTLLKYIIAIILLLNLSSCFEIVEELQLNNNGSGVYTLILNMSESKNKLNSVMVLDSVQGYKIPKKNDIANSLTKAKSKISSINGIKNVYTNFDYNEYIATIKFSFTDVQQINNAMKLIMDEYKVKNYSLPSYYFNTQAKQLVRNYQTQTSTLNQYNKLKTEDKDIFQKARFTSIYKFESEVKKLDNTTAKLSKNNKAVMQKANVHQIITNQTNISQRINL